MSHSQEDRNNRKTCVSDLCETPGGISRNNNIKGDLQVREGDLKDLLSILGDGGS